MTEQGERNGCALAGTNYCRMLNMHACEQCAMRSAEDLDRIQRDLDVYESLLPEGGVSQLFLSPTCQFCKGEEKGRRHGYALLYMAHPEPRRVQKKSLLKRTPEYGTMIPLQFAICPRCRRRFLWLNYAPVLFPVLFGGVGLAALSVDAVHDALASQATVAPFLVWCAILVAGILIGRGAAALARKRYEADMIVDAAQHPFVQQMRARGWTPVMRESRTSLLFSKSRLNKGLGTAADETRD